MDEHRDRQDHPHEVVVVGGGNAGISAAAKLLKDGAEDVVVVEPSQVHRYRPLLNYVGTGQAPMRSLERPMGSVVPRGSTWVQDSVVAVRPEESSVVLEGGRVLRYETLVVCPGLEEDWEATPGLREAVDAGLAVSTFLVGSVESVLPALRRARRGTVVFSVPPEPAPCGATALKPLLMALDHWRRDGVLGDLDVHLVLPGRAATGLERADERLERLLRRAGVTVHREARVASVDHRAGRVLLRTTGGAVTLEDVELAHVVPHYRAPAWVRDSGLADDSAAGLVDIDPETLRHVRHPSVWSIGDVARVETRPSGGALRKQVAVLAANVAAARAGGELERYDGYTVMPVTTGLDRLVLVEVDRHGRRQPSVPLVDLTRPRRTTWWFDRYVLPQVYFRRILRGRV